MYAIPIISCAATVMSRYTAPRVCSTDCCAATPYPDESRNTTPLSSRRFLSGSREFDITAFDVPHDGSDNMGFSIEYHGLGSSLPRDLGAVTERARHYMSRANYLVIEANYDSDMLSAGPYPEFLKARIRTTTRASRQQRHRLVSTGNHQSGTEVYLFLCHLSKDNNTPAKAIKSRTGRAGEQKE